LRNVQRDCQCEKCIGRRQKTPLAKLTMVQPLAMTPTGRDRRRQVGLAAKTPQSPGVINLLSPKSEETRAVT